MMVTVRVAKSRRSTTIPLAKPFVARRRRIKFWAQKAIFKQILAGEEAPPAQNGPRLKIGARCGAAERSRTPLLVGLSSGLLLVLLLVLQVLLRPRACQPCCMRAFSTHDAPAAARTSVPAAVDDSGRASPAPGRSSPRRGQRVSAALRRAAAPYADGCEQICGPSQPISLLILRVYLDVRMVHCIES